MHSALSSFLKKFFFITELNHDTVLSTDGQYSNILGNCALNTKIIKGIKRKKINMQMNRGIILAKKLREVVLVPTELTTVLRFHSGGGGGSLRERDRVSRNNINHDYLRLDVSLY
jgi:hypothetical protein